MRQETETLHNGARLLKRVPLKRHPELNIVLAETPQDMSDDRFATWEENPETGATYGGHYYDDLELALHDFRERVGEDFCIGCHYGEPHTCEAKGGIRVGRRFVD